jgi:exodeoxyribonuclease-3
MSSVAGRRRRTGGWARLLEHVVDLTPAAHDSVCRNRGVTHPTVTFAARTESQVGSPRTSREAARVARRQAEIDARRAISPAAPAPDRLRVATWNLNSLRTRLSAVERFIQRTQPDVLCLQETKAAQLSDEATAVFHRFGYHVTHVGASAYNGVAIATTAPHEEVVFSGDFGDAILDREPRLASCLITVPEPLRIVSVYAPHGRTVDHWHYQYKLSFFEALTARLMEWLRRDGHVVLAGDINVAATDSDVFHPDAFIGSTHVTEPERDALTRLLGAGLVDVDVARWGPRARRFTWWNHGISYTRNLGMRIDLIASDPQLAARLDTTWIDHIGRGEERPSDHAALVADFHTDALTQR